MISRTQWLPSQAAAVRPQQVPQLLPLTAVTGVANGRRRRAAADAVPRGLGGGGGELARDAKRDVYLVTISRVLPDALDQTDLADVEATSSEGVGRALLGALNGNGGGVVKKMAVFKPPGRDPARAGGAPTRCDLPRSALGPLRGPRAGRVAGRRDVAPRLGFHCPGDHESFESLQETQRSTASVPLDFLKQDVLSRVSTAWSSLHWRVKRNLCRRRHSSCVVVIRFASSSSCVVVFFNPVRKATGVW